MQYKQIFIILSLSALCACAGQESGPEEAIEDSHTRSSDCISKSSIRDYKVLDDQNLIVTEGASRRYHVVLSRKAYGMRASRGIGFQSATSRVCAGFDSLIVDDAFGADAFRISAIRRLTPEQEETLLVRFGLREPEFEQPRQPQDVEGAEVEELD